MLRRVLSALLAGGLLSVPVVGLSSRAGAVPVPWKNCGTALDLMQVQSVDASVWPPQAGKQISISIRASVARDIREATAALEVASGTEELNAAQPVDLPFRSVNAGPYQKLVTFTVPSDIRSQSFAMHLDVHDGSGAQVICAQVTIPFKGSTSDGSQGSFDQLLDEQLAIAGLSQLLPVVPITIHPSAFR